MPARKRARRGGGLTPAGERPLLVPLHDPDGSHPTLRALAEQYRAQQLCDCTVTVDGRAFLAHRCVLAAASDYFRVLMLSGGSASFADSQSAALELPELCATCFEAALEYVYTGSCSIDEAGLQTLLEVAGRLQLASLQGVVAEALEARLSVSNCVETWSFASDAALVRLEAAATAFVLKHFAEVSLGASLSPEMMGVLLRSEDIEASEEAVFSALVRWLRAQPKSAREEGAVAALLEHVRFAAMDQKFVRETVEQEPLMKNVPALTVLAQALREGLSKEGTARSLPRLPQGGEWVLEAPGAIAAVDGKTLTFLSRQDDDDEGTRDGLVRLSVPLATGRYEVRFKLLEDEVRGDNARCGFGLIKEGASEAFELQPWSHGFGVQNLWWLRRFERTVYSEWETSGNFDDETNHQPYQQFPIPSDVRIVVDMDAGEATFYVDEVEIPHKATGITGAVFPCAMAYKMENSLGNTNVVVSFAGVRRL